LRMQVRILVVFGIVLFGSSLLSLVSSITTGHFSAFDLVLPIAGFVVSFLMVRKTCWLLFVSASEERLLRSYERRIQRHPGDVYAYLAKICILMRLVNRDCERMLYFLAWDAAGKPAREIGPRVNKDLERMDTVVQALETLDRLHLLDGLARGWRTTSFEARIASARLEFFKRLFPLEVEKTPFDQPGFLLVHALEGLSAAIALNPLYPEAFACGAGLMEYLHREESASAFQRLATCLELALV
jgi:hypothetical protein